MDEAVAVPRHRVALVTGGGSGIGRATALRLAASGYDVAVLGRRSECLIDTVTAISELTEHGRGEALAVPADVRDRVAVDAAVDATVQRFGRLDVVVHAAAIGASGRRVHDLDDDDLAMVLDTNITGAVRACRAALPHLLAGGGGVVVLVGSTAGLAAMVGSADYGMTKAALVALTHSLAAEYGEHGLRAVCVAPGTTHTPMTEKLLADPATRAHLESLTPLGHLPDAADIAGVIAHLASPGCGVHGVVPVDSGYLARWAPPR